MAEEETPSGKDVPPEEEAPSGKGISRKQFIGGAAAAGAAVGLGGGMGAAKLYAQPSSAGAAADDGRDLALVNGKIWTMDPENRVVSQALIRNGRFAAVGSGVAAQGGDVRVVNLKGKTVIPGIIDGHNHIVLVGNRPGWSTGLEHVFTIPDAIAALQARVPEVPPGEFITCIGPISAQQFEENRLPTRDELDQVPRPVYIQAAQGGTRANSAAADWFAPFGITVQANGAPSNTGLALQTLRRELLTPETRKRSARYALQYFTSLGITTHRDSGAFHAELPATGIASENTYTMHFPFLALNRENDMPARLRIDFLHQDSATADPPLPTLGPRLRNSFTLFGNDWLRTGGIGEFTGGGLNGLRAIAAAGWRGEDHSLNLASATSHIANRELVHAEIPLTNLRWVISHIPGFTEDLANRAHAMGIGVLVGWGPTRTGTNVGPPYRMLFDHPITVGYHSDGGDITVISPWLNFYTMITGRNLIGSHILGDQTLTRWETLWLATAANKWFIWEEDVGSIEVGNHGDLVVLDRDFFTVPDEDIKGIQSLLTVVGGRVVHNNGIV